jgi:hypothetical protein
LGLLGFEILGLDFWISGAAWFGMDRLAQILGSQTGTQGIASPSLITNTTTITTNNASGNSVRCLFMGVLTKLPQKTWRFVLP